MKKILMLVASIVLVFSLAACGGNGSSKASGSSESENSGTTNVDNDGNVIDFANLVKPKTTITVWLDDEKGEYSAELISEFNKIYPDINVDFTHKGSVDSREALKTYGPSGNGCDVFQFPHDQLASAIKEDLVYTLSDDLKDELAKTLDPTALDIATVSYNEATKSFETGAGSSEKLFAVPMSVESVFIFYNKDLVTEEQAESFKTFSAIESAATAWQEKNDGYYLGTTSHWADAYFSQFALSVDGSDNGWRPFGTNGNDKSSVGYANTTSQLAWMTEHLKPITTGIGNADSVDGGAKFEAGTLPLVLGGPWNIEAFNKAEGLNYGAIETPSINGKESKSYTGAIMAAVYKKSKHPEEASKFVEFLASEKAMEIQYKYKGKLPALKSDLYPAEVLDDDILMVMAAQLSHTFPMPTIPSVNSYWGPAQKMIEQVWNDGVDPATAAATAETSYASNEGLEQ